MKKILIIFLLIIVSLGYVKNKDEIIIPNDSIRLRIISNSDNDIDIKTKLELKSYIENKIFDLIKEANDKEEVDQILVNNIDVINNYVYSFLNNKDYKISYGRNYFPKKIFKGVVYEEGYYDSLVITLGNGKGSNWWCSLFPPLCLVDNNTDDVEYKLYVSSIIQNFK